MNLRDKNRRREGGTQARHQKHARGCQPSLGLSPGPAESSTSRGHQYLWLSQLFCLPPRTSGRQITLLERPQKPLLSCWLLTERALVPPCSGRFVQRILACAHKPCTVSGSSHCSIGNGLTAFVGDATNHGEGSFLPAHIPCPTVPHPPPPVPDPKYQAPFVQ